MEKSINDYAHYTRLMREGFYDKLFFIDKLLTPWESIVDYGCADGFLSKLLGQVYPDKHVLGYDPNPYMIAAGNLTGECLQNVKFTTLISLAKGDVLLLSSVLHEIYSYGTEDSIKEFWKYVFDSGFKYIVIRDMMYDSNQAYRVHNRTWPAVIRKYCESMGFLGQLKHHEEIHGDLQDPKQTLHFMLKYLYLSSPNWDRELRENYFALNYHAFTCIVPVKYEQWYTEQYTLPYLRERWRSDLEIHTDIPTHAKIILRLKD